MDVLSDPPLGESTNQPVRIARSVSVEKAPYTPRGRHFRSAASEEETLRGCSARIVPLLARLSESASAAEQTNDYGAYHASLRYIDAHLVHLRMALKIVAPKESKPQFEANEPLLRSLWAAVDYLASSVDEPLPSLPSPGAPSEEAAEAPSSAIALQRSRSLELATPLRRPARLPAPPAPTHPLSSPVVAGAGSAEATASVAVPVQTAAPAETETSPPSSPSVEDADAFGDFHCRTPLLTATPRLGGSRLSASGGGAHSTPNGNPATPLAPVPMATLTPVAEGDSSTPVIALTPHVRLQFTMPTPLAKRIAAVEAAAEAMAAVSEDDDEPPPVASPPRRGTALRWLFVIGVAAAAVAMGARARAPKPAQEKEEKTAAVCESGAETSL